MTTSNNTTTLDIEWINPHDFVAHPDNRPGGLKEDHIESLAQSMRQSGYDADWYIKYIIPDEGWPEEYKAIRGKRVILGGHHRTEAAKRAGLAAIPARLKDTTYGNEPMSFLATLEFLDKDNDASILHWFEKLALHEKRRTILGESPNKYGERLGLKPQPNGSNSYSSQARAFRKLCEAEIQTNDLREISLNTSETVTSRATVPKVDYKAIFEEIRAGVLSKNTQKLEDTLRARYNKPTTTGKTKPVPNTTSYLYVASSPHTNMVKCGMTRGECPKKYVKDKATGTWVLEFNYEFSVEVPTTQIEFADTLMKKRLSTAWPRHHKEFYPASVADAKRVLKEIAKYCSDEAKLIAQTPKEQKLTLVA